MNSITPRFFAVLFVGLACAQTFKYFTSDDQENRTSLIEQMQVDMEKKVSELKKEALDASMTSAISDHCRDMGHALLDAKFHSLHSAIASLSGEKPRIRPDSIQVGVKMVSEGCSTGQVLGIISSSYKAHREVKDELLDSLTKITGREYDY